jgi:peptidylprolyl isomerase
MRRIPITILLTALTTAIALAQSQPYKKMPMPRPRSLADMSHPTRVSGEGVSTPSGLKYWDIRTGEGNSAAKGHVVKLLFRAWIENGGEIDGSPSIDKPTIFTVGAGQVIKGWEDGVEGMKPGGKRQIRIPADLAYGAAGAPPLVPPNANLIFDLELLEVQ